MKAFLIILALILLAGCAPSSEQLTATTVLAKAQTQTAAPTLTATPTFTPTFTSQPTSTLTAVPTDTPKPTPAPAGQTVKYSNLEITLLKAVTHGHIVIGPDDYYSKPGKTFIDIALLIRNREGYPLRVVMGQINITEETGDVWHPNFGGFKTVELEEHFDPMVNIKLIDTYSGDEVVTFLKDTYLRLVYYVNERQNILLSIRNSPQFIIPVK